MLSGHNLLRGGAIALTFPLLLSGCAMQETATGGNSFIQTATIDGKLMGGQQPMSGTTVDLYSVGATGYGSAGTLLASTITGTSGDFQFTQKSSPSGPTSPVSSTYGCVSNSDLLYLVASGGDPTDSGASSNSAIKFLDAIGACDTVSTGFYDIDEVATVVSIAALQQYISPLHETIGAPTGTNTHGRSTASTGIANAFALVGQILNYANGTVNQTYNPKSAAGTIVATPEAAKINTIADILAACVNTSKASSGPCNALFASATGMPAANGAATNYASSYTALPPAQDTLAAVLFMLTNPTDAGATTSTCNGGTITTNMDCLYSLAGGTPPFPGLANEPADWTIGVTYASASAHTVNGGTTTVGYLDNPESLAVDALGNVWVTGYLDPDGTGYGNGLTELSPQGGILQQVLTGRDLLVGPRNPVIDPAGNVWIPNFGSTTDSSPVGYAKTIVEYPDGGASSSGTLYNVGGGPFALASDGSGNIFIAETTIGVPNTGGGNGTAGGDLEKILAGSATGTTGTIVSPSSSYAASALGSIAIDGNLNVWVTTDGATVDVFAPPVTGATYTYASTSSGVSDSRGLVIDHTNDAFVSNAPAMNNLNEFTTNGTTITVNQSWPQTGTGVSESFFSVIDGAGNIWTTGVTGSSAGAITEVTNLGTLLSPPSAGFVHTYLNPVGIAVDPSGNVWVGNASPYKAAGAAASNNGPGGAGAGGYVTEIIGAAVPVVTPIASGLPLSPGDANFLGTPPE